MKFYVDVQNNKTTTSQFATFYVNGSLFGIDVMKVQEVAFPLKVTKMHSAPGFIRGLINLRGQIATAVNLAELLGLGSKDDTEKMTVVCKIDDVLLSLFVDQIGEIVEVGEESFEATPKTVSQDQRSFMKGVYKLENEILSVIDLSALVRELDRKCA